MNQWVRGQRPHQRVVGERFHPTLNDLGLAPLNTAQASRGDNQQTLLRMVASPVQGSRLLARGVTALQLYCGADLPLPSGPPQPYQPSARPPSITNPFSVVLHLEREVQGGTARNESGNACEQFRLKRTIWLRDGE